MPRIDADNYRNNVQIASELFSKHGSFIRAIISSKVQDEAHADDLFQDFFLDLVRKPVPNHVKNIKSYLYRAVTNDIIDFIRRRKRYEALIGKRGGNYSLSINETGAEDALIMKEEIDKVLGIIDQQLGSRECRAVALRYGKSMAIKEIAENMQIKRTSVSRYVSTGLKKIRQFLMVERGD